MRNQLAHSALEWWPFRGLGSIPALFSFSKAWIDFSSALVTTTKTWSPSSSSSELMRMKPNGTFRTEKLRLDIFWSFNFAWSILIPSFFVTKICWRPRGAYGWPRWASDSDWWLLRNLICQNLKLSCTLVSEHKLSQKDSVLDFVDFKITGLFIKVQGRPVQLLVMRHS